MWFFACWQPGDYVPPVPEDMTLVEDIAPEELELEASEAAPEGEAPPAEAEEPEAPVSDMEPWKGLTVGAPLSLVDARGQVVQVLAVPKMEVLVLAEEAPVRRWVRCTSCTPEVEGWLQFDYVERR